MIRTRRNGAFPRRHRVRDTYAQDEAIGCTATATAALVNVRIVTEVPTALRLTVAVGG